MTVSLEYHEFVNYSVKRASRRPMAWLTRLGVLLAPFLISSSQAQISSTSGGSVHSGSVAPPTAMAVAPPTALREAPPTGASVGRGFAPSTAGFAPSTNISHFPNSSHSHGDGHHRHRSSDGIAVYPYVYGVPIPYAVDGSNSDNSDQEDDADYQGGPTIFDRRGSGADSYIPPSSPGPAHAQIARTEDAPVAESNPEPPQPPTTLVFKDGHQLEVSNYAIVSQTLYDLTSGHPRKIALADLDLSATEKQNEDRGVVFQLPPSAQAN